MQFAQQLGASQDHEFLLSRRRREQGAIPLCTRLGFPASVARPDRLANLHPSIHPIFISQP